MLRKNNYFISRLKQGLALALLLSSPAIFAQLSTPLCINVNELEPGVSFDEGWFVDLNGNNAITGGNDGTNSYGYIYEFNNSWNLVQTISIPDAVTPGSFSNLGDVALNDQYAILGPQSKNNQGPGGDVTIFEKDAAGNYVLLASIPKIYTTTNATVEGYRFEMDGDQLILLTQFQSGTDKVDVYTRNGSSFDFDYQIFDGATFWNPRNADSPIELDGDDLVIKTANTTADVYRKNASGTFEFLQTLSTSASAFDDAAITMANGFIAFSVENNGDNSSLFQKDASGTYVDASGTYAANKPISYVSGNYGVFVDRTVVNQQRLNDHYLYEWDGTQWNEVVGNYFKRPYAVIYNPVFEFPHFAHGKAAFADVAANGAIIKATAHTFGCPGLPRCNSNSTPTQGTSDVLVTNHTFEWESRIDATGFVLAVGTTPGGTDILDNVDVGQVTSYTLSQDLPLDAVIYYTLIPYNDIGSASGCTEISFQTQGELLVECFEFGQIYRGLDGLWPLPTASTLCTVGGGTCTPAAIAGYTLIGEFDGNAYYISDVKEKWLDARASAIAAGGELASIPDAATNAYLQNAVPAGEKVHIGINDGTTEGTLEWTNGSALVYTNFKANEPSDADIEDRGVMKLNGKWKLLKDNKKRFYMELPCTSNPCAGAAIAGFSYIGAADNFNYYLADVKEKYNVAQTISAAAGGTLATIRSQEANDLLQANLPGVKVFIGINDLATEGDYVWESGEAIAYTRWANNYPDVNELEDYGRMRDDGEWTMYLNNKKFAFMSVPCSSSPNTPGEVTITQVGGDPYGQTYPPFTFNYSFLAEFEITDECGNFATCSYVVIIEDPNIGKTETDLDNLSQQPKLMVFPNPTNSQFSISIDNFKGSEQVVQIFDVLGKRVYLEKLNATGEFVTRIDGSSFGSGIYTVIVTSDLGEKQVQRLTLIK